MASSIQVYNVVITNGNTNSTPSDGFIDNVRIEEYGISSLETTPSGLSNALSQAKRRANVRYNEIIRQLELVTNSYVVPASVVATAATYKTEASAFHFQFWAEHGDGSFVTADESNPGQFLTSTNAIIRCIARALIPDLFKNIDVFDPSDTTTTGVYGASSVIRFGPRIAQLEIGPYAISLAQATALIAVTPLL